MHKDYFYFEHSRHQAPVEAPQPQFSAPMMVIEGGQLVVKQGTKYENA